MCCFRCHCIGPSTRIDPGKTCFVVIKRCECHRPLSLFFFKLHGTTLLVIVWMREKGIFVPWTINCTLCKTAKTVDHVSIHCWDAVYFFYVLKRIFKKELCINSYTIRFFPVRKLSIVPYDIIPLLGLYSTRRSWMAARLADKNPQPVNVYFVKVLTRLSLFFSHMK